MKDINLINDGEIMFECDLPIQLTVIPATVDKEYFVHILFVQNREFYTRQILALRNGKNCFQRKIPTKYIY